MVLKIGCNLKEKILWERRVGHAMKM